MKWFYADRQGQQVEFDESELESLIETGCILPTTLVWNATMNGWQSAVAVKPEFFKDAVTHPPALVGHSS
ncbi:MAG: DUF4339 domain-containing protein, partial [Verrucomicrobiota bacterium]